MCGFLKSSKQEIEGPKPNGGQPAFRQQHAKQWYCVVWQFYWATGKICWERFVLGRITEKMLGAVVSVLTLTVSTV